MTLKKTVLVFLLLVFWGYTAGCEGKHTTKEEHYPDGKLKAVFTCNDAGLLDGEATKYFPNGKPQSEQTYKNNLLDGISREYYENGKIKTEGNYKDGKLEGINKSYYETGTLKSAGNYKAGIPEGGLADYDENGKIKKAGVKKADTQEDTVDVPENKPPPKSQGKNKFVEPKIWMYR
jgi:antitoxin component YwqK of YwqJK toxin-antitoxin module